MTNEEQGRDLASRAAIEALQESLKDYGCQLTLRSEKKGLLSKETKLIIEQKAGQGLAIGYDADRQNLWVAPDASPGVHYWNTNTDLRLGKSYRGIGIEKTGQKKLSVDIVPDHPLARLVAVLKSRGWKGEIRLAGEGTHWDPSSSPTVSTEEDGKLRAGGVSPGQSKLVLTGIQAEWQDAKWRQGERQRLKIE